MRKYFKWILLVILGICIFVTFILYVNYTNNILYYKKFSIKMISVYYNGNLLVEENINNNKYIVFNKNVIKCCDSLDNSCYEYNYSNLHDKIIFFEDNIIGKGVYKMILEDDSFKLSKEINGREVIYSFVNINK